MRNTLSSRLTLHFCSLSPPGRDVATSRPDPLSFGRLRNYRRRSGWKMLDQLALSDNIGANCGRFRECRYMAALAGEEATMLNFLKAGGKLVVVANNDRSATAVCLEKAAFLTIPDETCRDLVDTNLCVIRSVETLELNSWVAEIRSAAKHQESNAYVL